MNQSTTTKNLNVYWIGATLLAFWFLFVHAPPFIVKRRVFFEDPALALHLVGAYSVYLACSHNALITPSIAKNTHIWVGRIGMIGGIIGVTLGAYCCWWPTRWDLVDRAFAIFISIGGSFQIVTQVVGYSAIRRYQSLSSEIKTLQDQNMEIPETLKKSQKTALLTHVTCMVGLFIGACGIPAAIRLVESVVPSEDYFGLGIMIAIVVLNIYAGLYGGKFIKSFGDADNDSGIVNSRTRLIV